jgi:multiple antibiotic resistance protein
MGTVIQAAKSILLVVSALFPIVDPIGGSPIFLSLTRDYTADTRRLLSRRIAMNSFILLGSALVAVTIYLCYGFADRLGDAMGPSGMNVIIRLSPFLLVCIGVQILWNGASKLLSSLPHVIGFVARP